ncbi:MAG: hypothetical protein ABI041_07740 [Bdellovibrionia bacterium]
MHSREFAGKTALITGGTKGLGLATALLLAKEGVDLTNIILFLCSEKSKWMVGQTLYADGGFQFSL